MLMCIAHFVDAERHIASYDFKPLSTIAARSTCTSHEDKETIFDTNSRCYSSGRAGSLEL